MLVLRLKLNQDMEQSTRTTNKLYPFCMGIYTTLTRSENKHAFRT